MAEWHVYMVRCADRSLYTGVATHVQKSAATHNARKGAQNNRRRALRTM